MIPALVVKVGGSLAREPDLLGRALRVVVFHRPPPLVVPGGGPLADAVRRLHAAGGLSEETSHRMALLALDQAALWMAELAAAAGPVRIVASRDAIAGAVDGGALPVLAPARWAEREEPLPASWEVTSDSIAAWAAGRLGARRLVLVKAFRFRRPEVSPGELGDAVDPFFLRALPEEVECRFVDGHDPGLVLAALEGAAGAGTLLRRDASVLSGRSVAD